MTPLIWATLAGHVECIKVLLDWGAQTNHQDKVSAQTNTYVTFSSIITIDQLALTNRVMVYNYAIT